ncbi:MAG: bifunctional oligoribonuclease/PAP phosphatase NrnA [Phycisphaerales bacterium]
MSETSVYEGNATLAQIADDLKKATRVVITTHAKPDGDAIGSTLALHRALRTLGVESVVVYLGYFPERFEGVVRADDVVLHDADETGEVFTDERCTGADRVVICDTGARQQVRSAGAFLEGRSAMTTIVDHHRSGDADMAGTRHIDITASAACVLIAELCAELLGTSPASFDASLAEPIYLGTATDTGWFRHTNTDPRTLRLAADLLERGVDTDRLIRMSEYGDPPGRVELLRRALNGTRLFAGDRAAIMKITAHDLETSGVAQGDTGGIVDVVRSVRTVEVVALLVEIGDGRVKVSMRSKGGASPVDVASIAQAMGGGGHFHAAGARVEGDMEFADHLVERLLTDALG